jgi:phosphoketolase
MLLKDAAKAISNNIDHVLDVLPESDKAVMSISALRTSIGYILCLSSNNKTVAIISSKREERRVFKTLDAISRALKGVGINKFEVYGTK